MRRSTLAYAVVLVAAAIGLVVSARGLRQARRAPGGKRVYRFACWGAAREMDELRRLVIDPLNARAGEFEVRCVPIPSDYYTKLCTMIAGGTPPDFFYLSQEYLPAFAAQGALLDLTDRASGDGEPVTDLDTYYPSVLARYRHDGRLYGLPWIAQPVILYCNAKLFRQGRVALPDRSWDWNRFLAAARQLTRDTDGDGRTDQWGFIVTTGWPPPQMWVWQNGSRIVTAGGRLNLDDERALEAIDAYAALIHTHKVAPPLSVVSERGFSELFRAGKVAMFMGGAADDLDRIAGLEVVAAEVPSGPSGRRATFAWTAGLCISPGVEDAAQAFEVYKRILDGIQRWKIPAPRRPLAARLEQFDPTKAPAADVIRSSMEYMRVGFIRERQVEWDTVFSEEFIEPILRTGRPARQQLRRARKALEAGR